MLAIMRRGAQSWVAKGLFIILLASFAVWGIGPIFQGAGRLQTAAEAGNVKISAAEADVAFKQQIRQFEQQYGMTLNADMIAQLGFKRQILQQLVMQALYDQEAGKLGLRLGTELVQQTIAAQPNFRAPNGQFDPNLFRQLLGQIGMSEQEYVAAIKGDIIRLLLMGSIRGSTQPSDTLARTVYAYRNERRVVEATEIKAADMTGVARPSDEELNKYLADNGSNFMAPEYRSITYVAVDLAKIAAAVPLTPEDVKAVYDTAPQDYGTPETRDIVQIITQDQALAEKIAAEAASKPLDEVAKANDVAARPAPGITRAGIMPELGDIIFTLEASKTSQAVQSPMGWHVIEVTKVSPAVPSSFDEVKNQIEANLRLQKGQEVMFEATRKLQDAIASGSTLAEAAEQLDLNAVKIDAVTADGYKPDGTQITNQPILATVLKTAFQLPQGQPSQVEEIPSGSFSVVVDTITPAQTKALADVKDEVVTAWTNARRLELATTKANELAEQVRNGTAVRGMARSQPLLRDGSNVDKLPQTALPHIFDSKVGDVLTAATDTSVWVIKVNAVNPAIVDGADLSAIRTELKEQMSNDMLEQFAGALRGSYGVELNDAWLQQSADSSN